MCVCVYIYIYIHLCVCVCRCVCIYICISVQCYGKTCMNFLANPILINIYIQTDKFIRIWLDSDLFYI